MIRTTWTRRRETSENTVLIIINYHVHAVIFPMILDLVFELRNSTAVCSICFPLFEVFLPCFPLSIIIRLKYFRIGIMNSTSSAPFPIIRVYILCDSISVEITK